MHVDIVMDLVEGHALVCTYYLPSHYTSSNEVEGLPPILNFGKPALRDKIAPEVLAGKKFTCLAVTEAFAGSDVAGLKCFAKRVEDGWVVNGTYELTYNSLVIP
jgi:alkylation response protein AidB-like acyl-CoA dehydrogenase